MIFFKKNSILSVTERRRSWVSSLSPSESEEVMSRYLGVWGRNYNALLRLMLLSLFLTLIQIKCNTESCKSTTVWFEILTVSS